MMHRRMFWHCKMLLKLPIRFEIKPLCSLRGVENKYKSQRDAEGLETPPVPWFLWDSVVAQLSMRVPWFRALLGIRGQERNFQENNCHSISSIQHTPLCPGVWVHELGPCLGGFWFSNCWQERWVEEEGEELCWFAKDTVEKCP